METSRKRRRKGEEEEGEEESTCLSVEEKEDRGAHEDGLKMLSLSHLLSSPP